jgi:hypothetical protein
VTQAQYLTLNLNSERDISQCRFVRQRIVYVVERVKKIECDLTCPFVAQSLEHAQKWCNQPHAQAGEFAARYVPYIARYCHCGAKKVIRKARPEEVTP